jgi:hypothetical protein
MSDQEKDGQKEDSLSNEEDRSTQKNDVQMNTPNKDEPNPKA